MKTKTLPKWSNVELPFSDPRLSTLDDLARLDPDRGWAVITLRIPSYGFRGRTETIRLLTLLLDHEGHEYDSQTDWDWLTMTGTISRLVDLIDCHLISKGRRA